MKIRIVRVPFLIKAIAQVWPFGIIAIARRTIPTTELISHELVHMEQINRFGGYLGFLLVYLWLWILHGFDHHPLELEANRRSPEFVVIANRLILDFYE